MKVLTPEGFRSIQIRKTGKRLAFRAARPTTGSGNNRSITTSKKKSHAWNAYRVSPPSEYHDDPIIDEELIAL